MPSASLKVEVTGLDDAERHLRALVAAASDLTPVMKDIGEHLLNTTRERFKDEQGPLGAPWAPLSEHTKRRKKRNAGRILTRDGYLGGTLAVEAGRVYPRVSGGTIEIERLESRFRGLSPRERGNLGRGSGPHREADLPPGVAPPVPGPPCRVPHCLAAAPHQCDRSRRRRREDEGEEQRGRHLGRDPEVGVP